MYCGQGRAGLESRSPEAKRTRPPVGRAALPGLALVLGMRQIACSVRQCPPQVGWLRAAGTRSSSRWPPGVTMAICSPAGSCSHKKQHSILSQRTDVAGSPHHHSLIRKLPGWLACEQSCTRQGQDLKRSGHDFAECGWITGLDPKVPPGLSTGVKRRLEPWVHVWPAELMLGEVLGCAGGPSGHCLLLDARFIPSARSLTHTEVF